MHWHWFVHSGEWCKADGQKEYIYIYIYIYIIGSYYEMSGEERMMVEAVERRNSGMYRWLWEADQ